MQVVASQSEIILITSITSILTTTHVVGGWLYAHQGHFNRDVLSGCARYQICKRKQGKRKVAPRNVYHCYPNRMQNDLFG